MKKLILTLAAALLLPAAVFSGEITKGSVPGTLNYQGRLERDNAPITGPIHLYFRIFNSATANNTGGGACGGVSQPCLWESPELTVQAAQGIFSASITPPVSVLAGGQSLYLEVQVESDTLSPREPLNSVAYALVAKKLEDGTDVLVSTLSATYNVSLATAAGAVLTVGTDSPSSGARLTLDGWLKINTGGIIFPDNSSMNVASVASAGNIANDFDADVLADRNGDGTGGVVLRKPTLQYLRVTNTGLVGIGPNFTDSGLSAPKGALDVDGTLYVGNEGIYDRDDTTVNVMANLSVRDGRVTGDNGEYLALGEADNVIVFGAGGERMRVHSNGFLGVGTNSPAVRIHSSDNMAADAGVRGGRVSIGDYSTWTNLLNEVRAEDTYHLLLQQTNSYNVGIGTDTPREKLHVRGSVRSDYGIIASTAAFSGNVRVNGTFSADSKQGNTVELSSTTINGWLIVSGGIGSEAGLPAYIASTQTFTGLNTFRNQVVVSSDIVTLNRIGAGVVDFDFPGTKYLQVGDNQGGVYANDNGLIYLVGGSNADAKLNFYRGTTLGATLETQGASNLATVVGGQTKTLTDSVYHRIQNSVVWVSTGYNTTPAIFVSSYMGNVGMGTTVMDPNWRLTVNGNLRISGALSNGIIFADGTTLNSAGSIGSATNISANGDAVVQSNADLSGGGDVVLRAGSLDGLVLNTGGYVGIGTLSPASKLNLRGGDLLLGAPYNPYGSDSVEDLVVAGNIAFDGELVQRSALPVKLSELIVAEDVFLSTSGTGLTGINTLFPVTKLDVNGNAQFGSGAAKSTFTAAGVLQLAADLAVQYGGTGAGTFTDGGILFGNGTAAIGATAVMANGELLIGDGTQEPSVATLTGTANQVTVTNGPGSITLSLPQNIHTAADPTFNSLTLTTDLTVANGGTGAGTFTDGGILFGNGTAAIGATAVMANGELLIGDGTQEPSVATLTGTANQVTVTNGPGSITLGLPQNIHTAADPTFANTTVSALTASSGTFRTAVAGGYSIATSSGINVSAGTLNVAQHLNVGTRVVTPAFRMPTGAFLNYVLASDAFGNASWVNPAGGGLGDGWVGNEITNAANGTLTRSGLGTSGNPYEIELNLGSINTWTAAQTFNGGVTMGGTLAVGANNITMTGSLGATGARLTKGWFTDLEVTNTITGSVSGTAANVTGTVAIANGGTGQTTAANARTALNVPTRTGGDASGTWGIDVTGTAANVTGTVAIANGGTGQTTAANARTALNVPTRTGGDASGTWGIDVTGTAANVTGTVAIGNGGTGATTAANARTALGLGGGVTGVMTIRNGGGAADCTVTYVNGIVTATTCNFI